VLFRSVGRYYAMDRDKRWERTKIAYDAMVHGVGDPAPDPVTAIRRAYEAGETDEFVTPRVIAGMPRIRSGDGVFCFNFRADRMRQDRKSTRLNSSHDQISYAVFCLKKKKNH